jgi:hypothetical protein
MPCTGGCVFCTDKKELENQIKQILDGKLTNVPRQWFEKCLKCQNKPQALFGIPSKLF